MWDNLELVLQFAMSMLSNVVVLYFTNGLLAFAFAIYAVRKVSNILQHLR